MAYRIKMLVKLANPYPVGEMTENTKDFFLKACSLYEEASAQSRVNKKSIEVNRDDINNDGIVLTLVSEVDISESPGRALSPLSRILIDSSIDGYDPFFEQNLYYRRLFTTVVVDENTFREISDTEMVHILIDYLAESKSNLPDKKKNAIKRIKAILRENDFVK